MRLSILILVSILTGGVALADTPPPPRVESAWGPMAFTWHNVPWAGMAAGSMRLMRSSLVTTLDNQAPETRTSERRETLLEVTETQYVIKVEYREGDSWRAEPVRRLQRPLSDRAIIELLGPGEVTIEGETLSCQWRRMMRVNSGEIVENYDVCTDQTHGVVDVKQTHPYRALSKIGALYVKHKVGTQDLNCRLFILNKEGKTGASRSLMCLEVPGMMTRIEERFEIDGGTRVIRDELVDFKRIPRGDGVSP